MPKKKKYTAYMPVEVEVEDEKDLRHIMRYLASYTFGVWSGSYSCQKKEIPIKRINITSK